jgi:Skp family chaperone for outer membrane proteins
MNMMTKIWLGLFGLALATSSFAQATGRIVTIDMQKVFDQYYKTPTARAKLEETRDQFTKELQTKQEELKKHVDELNKLREDQDRPEYTPEVREEKRKKMTEKLGEMQKMQRDLEEYRRSHQKILEEQSLRMRQNILKEITDVVLKEAKDAGYLLVLDKSGNTLNGLPAVVFSQDALEITAEIIKILNKNQPVGTSPAKP